MSEQFNKNHLLWWILRALDETSSWGEAPNLQTAEIWQQIDAPSWVFPAILEKYGQFRAED